MVLAATDNARQTPTQDTRRITEDDADYQRLHARYARKLRGSIATLVRGLRSGDQSAVTAFLHRHTDLMRQAYLAAHEEGQRDYWQSVSLKQPPIAVPSPHLVERRLAWYALGSVLKMAREAQDALTASRRPITQSEALDAQNRIVARLVVIGDVGGESNPLAFPPDSAAHSTRQLPRTDSLLPHQHSPANPRSQQFITLAGHEPGYEQNRNSKGQWAPGDGDGHSSGGVRGRGDAVREALTHAHEDATGATGGGGGQAHELKKGWRYFLRSTQSPEADIARDWVGWMGSAYASKADAIHWAIREFEPERDIEHDYHQYLRETGQHDTRAEWQREDGEYPDHFMHLIAEREGIDVRYHEQAQKWMVVHHAGLAGYTLDATNYADAVKEAAGFAVPHGGAHAWHGDQTVGSVRYIGPLPNHHGWHLFAAEHTQGEDDTTSGALAERSLSQAQVIQINGRVPLSTPQELHGSIASREADGAPVAVDVLKRGRAVLRSQGHGVVIHSDLDHVSAFGSLALGAHLESPLASRLHVDNSMSMSACQGASIQLAGTPDPLAQWQASTGNRADLQAAIGWSGIQDGYLLGGQNDGAAPFALVYWELGIVKTQHCDDCPAIAAGSPYNAPGSGGNELMQTPGDGRTACGSKCNCSLAYKPLAERESIYVAQQWQNYYNSVRGGGSGVDYVPSTIEDFTKQGPDVVTGSFNQQMRDQLPQEPLITPPQVPIEVAQKRALDRVRGARAAWDEVRAQYPDLPEFPWYYSDDGSPNAVPMLYGKFYDYAQVAAALSRLWDANAVWLSLNVAGDEAPSDDGGETQFAEIMLGGHQPGYTQDRDKGGRWGPGDGGAHVTAERGSLGRLFKALGRVATTDQIGRLAGGGKGDTVHLTRHGVLEVLHGHDGSRSEVRVFHMDGEGGAHLLNWQHFDAEGKRAIPDARDLARQVRAARELNVEHFTVKTAHEAHDWVAYTKLGYDAPTDAHLVEETKLRELIPPLTTHRTLLEIVATPEGAKWWDENGNSPSLFFDTGRGSPSVRVLNTALAALGAKEIMP